MKKDALRLIVGITFVIGCAMAMVLLPEQPIQPACHPSPIKTIDSLRYRDAIVTLENGERVVLNQATADVGTVICSTNYLQVDREVTGK